MTTTDPLSSFGTNIPTPQNRPAPGKDQVKNNAGGYVFTIDPLTQLRRFLTIGSAGGSYYASAKDLTEENGNLILELTKSPETHKQLVDEIVSISLEGRAPKQNPALFALAIACQHGEPESKKYARQQITKVVRTGTHLFIFMRYLKQFGGWGRGLRREVGNWYTEKSAPKLAYQLVKYRQREGYTHRDVLRLTHPKATTPFQASAINWAVKGETDEMTPFIISAYEDAQKPGADIPALIREFKLPWEALPDSAMNEPATWEAMLDAGMPLGALLRQLPRLTNLGVIGQMGKGRTSDVVKALIDEESLKRARMHPVNVLVAAKTYSAGRGMRSQWQPVPQIVDALDEMFYRSFKHVEPTGKRMMLALDVSGSMDSPCGGVPLTCREVVGALAMTTVRTEEYYQTVAFTSVSGYYNSFQRGTGITTLPLSPRQRLDDVLHMISRADWGGTDCSLPMQHALKHKLEVDTFVIYTDNDTWAGRIHPFQALKQYRREMGIDARLAVVAVTPTKFSIADPSDAGMMDISGFDSAVPQILADFAAKRI